jgi:hypothetical protein
MHPSNHGQKASGVGKFWVAVNDSNPEVYHHGPYPDLVQAEMEADQLMEEGGADVATIGEGEEVYLRLPDADDVFERIEMDVYEQCGEGVHHWLDAATKEQKQELTDAIEKVVADWMTRHGLWPTFCRIEQVKTVRTERRPVFDQCQACGRGLSSEDLEMNNGMCVPCANH